MSREILGRAFVAYCREKTAMFVLEEFDEYLRKQGIAASVSLIYRLEAGDEVYYSIHLRSSTSYWWVSWKGGNYLLPRPLSADQFSESRDFKIGPNNPLPLPPAAMGECDPAMLAPVGDHWKVESVGRLESGPPPPPIQLNADMGLPDPGPQGKSNVPEIPDNELEHSPEASELDFYAEKKAAQQPDSIARTASQSTSPKPPPVTDPNVEVTARRVKRSRLAQIKTGAMALLLVGILLVVMFEGRPSSRIIQRIFSTNSTKAPEAEQGKMLQQQRQEAEASLQQRVQVAATKAVTAADLGVLDAMLAQNRELLNGNPALKAALEQMANETHLRVAEINRQQEIARQRKQAEANLQEAIRDSTSKAVTSADIDHLKQLLAQNKNLFKSNPALRTNLEQMINQAQARISELTRQSQETQRRQQLETNLLSAVQAVAAKATTTTDVDALETVLAQNQGLLDADSALKANLEQIINEARTHVAEIISQHEAAQQRRQAETNLQTAVQAGLSQATTTADVDALEVMLAQNQGLLDANPALKVSLEQGLTDARARVANLSRQREAVEKIRRQAEANLQAAVQAGAAKAETSADLGALYAMLAQHPDLLATNPAFKASLEQEIEAARTRIVYPSFGKEWENSLGIKFVPVPGTQVLFAIWDVRVEDYQVYAQANIGVDQSWRKPQFSQGLDHPVVNVSWYEAKAFCDWLTKKEHGEGKIGPSQAYRLPLEGEWDKAVGPTAYPWGEEESPPRRAGNYSQSLGVDRYDYTSPVGSFKPNQFGLYDMGGNVWQWCQNEYSTDSGSRVLRGASWRDSLTANMLSTYRYNCTPESRSENIGFRVVLEESDTH